MSFACASLARRVDARTSANARVALRARRGARSAGRTPSNRPQKTRLRLKASDDDVPKMRAGELKRVLVDAGVDVSDCFERADLEAKYVAWIERGGERDSTKTTSSASVEDDASETDGAKPFERARKWFDEQVETARKSLSADALWASARETANRLNAKYGAGDKAKSVLDDARRMVKNADTKIGATKWFKKNVPKVMDKYAEVRATPVGKFANFMFYIWLFTSGVFWNLFYFGLIATFLVNLLYPSLITDQLENMQRRAQERVNAMGGMGGTGYDPRMSGMGGMGYDPRTRGMGGMGGSPGGASGGRKSYGGGSTGDTIDVDAKVSDRD